MKLDDLRELERRLVAGDEVPCALVAGGDNAVVDAVVECMRRWLSKRLSSVRLARYDAGQPRTEAWQKLAETATQVPMFGDGVVFRIDHCAPGALPKELAEFLESPPAHVRLVLHSDRRAQSSGLGQAVRKVGVVVASRPLSPGRAMSFVHGLTREHGVRLQDEAAALLADLVGTDRADLASALEQLVQANPQVEFLKTEHVRAVLGRMRKTLPWEIEDALCGARWNKLLKVAIRAASDEGRATPVLWSVARTVKKAVLAGELSEAQVPVKEAMERLGLRYDFQYDRLRHADSRLGRTGLVKFLALFPALEHVAKTRRLDPETVAVHIVITLLHCVEGAKGPSAY